MAFICKIVFLLLLYMFICNKKEKMKNTSVRRTFHYLMGHTYSVVKIQVFT